MLINCEHHNGRVSVVVVRQKRIVYDSNLNRQRQNDDNNTRDLC